MGKCCNLTSLLLKEKEEISLSFVRTEFWQKDNCVSTHILDTLLDSITQRCEYLQNLLPMVSSNNCGWCFGFRETIIIKMNEVISKTKVLKAMLENEVKK